MTFTPAAFVINNSVSIWGAYFLSHGYNDDRSDGKAFLWMNRSVPHDKTRAAFTNTLQV